ncbi:RidA family protein [Bordetella hinzii]|uniref:RidA family protein n=1 Tax=Bordetella hinzii TaxID=103855 RepID=A0AAN1VEC0_9BORD|nr:RidA family protein [Bordetella hinzii]AKQ54579.1 RutC family protein YjgH [Bordetella hinzii]AKQ59092.1 RutC family protein YjgH [Bordetella hinzii]AZW15641.1 RidA family protein [Bordetella hinzii]KCB41056.1 endoribonuclease L-PSP [Bordetella hinzii 5132]KCB47444.1 endoribonuclease L-PSP [Bordetella hinzii 4161]
MHSSLKAVLPAGSNPKSTFSPAIRAGDFLYISGMTAMNAQRELVGEGDIAEQARFIYQKMGAILAEAGGDYSRIVETVEYVTTFDGYGRTADVRREVFGEGPYPAATGVLVSGLVRPGALIEIRAIAYLG